MNRPIGDACQASAPAPLEKNTASRTTQMTIAAATSTGIDQMRTRTVRASHIRPKAAITAARIITAASTA